MLKAQQLHDIESLQKVCESHDNLKLKLNWDMLRSRGSQEPEDFFMYESSLLVGFIGIYGFGDKVELCGMVHPNFRNNGIFTKLFQQAIEACKNQGFERILLNAPADSVSASEFLKKLPCIYSISEYQMKYNHTPLECNNDIVLRQASSLQDKVAAIELDMKCFDMTEEAAKSFNERVLEEGTYYIIEVEGKTVGKIRVYREHGESWIYSFAVYPEYQGKGIGRKALTNVVLDEAKHVQDIYLEVEIKNEHALGLYKSCGFEQFHTQDYYVYKG
ncbi:GNAT family N-acetyltransferase [Bacillus luteolus]|uniref:GNAT family N-acetyltransferase n=1 Tax=Litchfieldia luteola TaxID=682179 RepID=A0ABR9QMI4_9BACI|nr:GNAT family N-acetyltransferase [Cytobacillus luteolus]MBE4909616.1 GNAT family N-acetyltransferase [Cytobacillus luteolus]MBP1941017.1 ribosomal protein S18 acetylase RimI-like enzyme [Cytobacillus luteolus]